MQWQIKIYSWHKVHKYQIPQFRLGGSSTGDWLFFLLLAYLSILSGALVCMCVRVCTTENERQRER